MQPVTPDIATLRLDVGGSDVVLRAVADGACRAVCSSSQNSSEVRASQIIVVP